MKQVLLMLALAGGVMGCDPGEKLRAPERPKINPLTLLDQSLGIREAVCQYGLQTQQLRDLDECGKFWKSKDRDMRGEIEDYNRRHNSSRYFNGPGAMRYELMPDGVTLVMFIGSEKPEHSIAQKVYIMRRNIIDWK